VEELQGLAAHVLNVLCRTLVQGQVRAVDVWGLIPAAIQLHFERHSVAIHGTGVPPVNIVACVHRNLKLGIDRRGAASGAASLARAAAVSHGALLTIVATAKLRPVALTVGQAVDVEVTLSTSIDAN
jgi:hypothetical protein